MRKFFKNLKQEADIYSASEMYESGRINKRELKKAINKALGYGRGLVKIKQRVKA